MVPRDYTKGSGEDNTHIPCRKLTLLPVNCVDWRIETQELRNDFELAPILSIP